MNMSMSRGNYEAGGELNITDYLALAKTTLKNPACGKHPSYYYGCYFETVAKRFVHVNRFSPLYLRH